MNYLTFLIRLIALAAIFIFFFILYFVIFLYVLIGHFKIVSMMDVYGGLMFENLGYEVKQFLFKTNWPFK